MVSLKNSKGVYYPHKKITLYIDNYDLLSLVGIVYGLDYNGIWSFSIPKLSFLINGNVFGKCFRCCLSWIDPCISPLLIQYKYPQPFLFIIIKKKSTNQFEFLSDPFLLSHAFLFKKKNRNFITKIPYLFEAL